MRRNHRRQSLISEINITPFTDVILVLLMIFIITTPLILQSSIKVDLPQASAKNTTEEIKPVEITVTTEGVVYLGKEVVTHKELKQKVLTLIQKDRNLTVVLLADQSTRFKEVVDVIDMLTDIGVKSLNIATKTKS